MKKIYFFFSFLMAAFCTGVQANAQEKSEIKISTSKVYGAEFEMFPKSTALEDTIFVDWGDGEIKKYNFRPNATPYNSKCRGKIMGDTIRIFTKLVKLDLDDCQVDYFSATNQPLLKQLTLSNNKLTSDSLSLDGAPNLTYLSLNNNNLSVFDARQFKNMEIFSASENPNLGSVLFPDSCESLRNISLSGCDIAHFYPIYLPNLRELSINGGALMDLEVGSHYPSLSALNVSDNYLTEIDVTECPNLETLSCSGNMLKELNLMKNPKLVNLYCGRNQLTQLNVENNTEIVTLSCDSNFLKKVDFSMLYTLARLDVSHNQLSRLDLSQNFKMNRLICSYNELEFLDFAGNPNMEFIDCRFNSKMNSNTVNYMFSTLLGLKSDSYSPNLLIEGCNAEHSNTAAMNTTDMKWKTDINGDGTAKFFNVKITIEPSENGTFTLSQPTEYGQKYQDITTEAVISTPIKVTATPAADFKYDYVLVNGEVVKDTVFVIEADATIQAVFKTTKVPVMKVGTKDGKDLSFALMAAENNTEITIDWGNGVDNVYQIGKKNTRIDGIAAGDTLKITGAVVEADLGSLPDMGIWDNGFTSFSVENNPNLEALSTYMNPIKKLDVTGCPNLEFLDCSYSELTELNVKNNTKLISLKCYNNELAKLDVTNAPALVELVAKNNKLTEIDLSKNLLLKYLYLQGNLLTKVDVDSLNKLAELAIAGNKLTEIDLSKNPSLYILDVSQNQLKNLDLSKNDSLGKVLCADNQIANLDLSNKPTLFYVDCQGNKMTACALTDLYYSLNEYPTLKQPSKGNTLWVKGLNADTQNDAEHAESIIATGKGWKINYEGDGSGCSEAYITILETRNGKVAVFTEDDKPVLSGTKVKKGSVLKVVATADKGYEVDKIVANGEKLAADAKFTVERATDIAARFVKFTGIENAQTEGLVVNGAKGAIKVMTEAPAMVTVYTTDGKQVAQENVQNSTNIALSAATYLVKVQTGNKVETKLVIVF